MAYVMKISAAHMPSSCRGRYVRVAVMETDGTCYPSMISARARGVRRIVRVWERCHVGKTGQSAAARAIAEAQALINTLEMESK